MVLEPMSAVGVILVASFAVDRVVTALLFLLSLNPNLRSICDPDSVQDQGERDAAKKEYRLLYAIFAGYLSTVVIAGLLGIRLMTLLGAQLDPNTQLALHPLVDVVLTGCILVGGSDRIADGLKLMAGSRKTEAQSPPPLEITGTLVLQDGTARLEV